MTRQPATAAGRRTAVPTNAAGGPLLEPHDGGCRCWPHVSQKDAFRAVEHAGLMEYRSRVAEAAPDAGLPFDAAKARANLTSDTLRRLGVPKSLMSNFEFGGALYRDRQEDGKPFTDGKYDRRGLLNVIAFLATQEPK